MKKTLLTLFLLLIFGVFGWLGATNYFIFRFLDRVEIALEDFELPSRPSDDDALNYTFSVSNFDHQKNVLGSNFRLQLSMEGIIEDIAQDIYREIGIPYRSNILTLSGKIDGLHLPEYKSEIGLIVSRGSFIITFPSVDNFFFEGDVQITSGGEVYASLNSDDYLFELGDDGNFQLALSTGNVNLEYSQALRRLGVTLAFGDISLAASDLDTIYLSDLFLSFGANRENYPEPIFVGLGFSGFEGKVKEGGGREISFGESSIDINFSEWPPRSNFTSEFLLNEYVLKTGGEEKMMGDSLGFNLAYAKETNGLYSGFVNLIAENSTTDIGSTFDYSVDHIELKTELINDGPTFSYVLDLSGKNIYVDEAYTDDFKLNYNMQKIPLVLMQIIQDTFIFENTNILPSGDSSGVNDSFESIAVRALEQMQYAVLASNETFISFGSELNLSGDLGEEIGVGGLSYLMEIDLDLKPILRDGPFEALSENIPDFEFSMNVPDGLSSIMNPENIPELRNPWSGKSSAGEFYWKGERQNITSWQGFLKGFLSQVD